jgi:thiamine kinase-like enzyme
MLDITLGDCKPENFIISTDDKIYVLDLEQGERKGDIAWDIAEYCYFSGHYGNTLTTGLQQFIKSFIEGYTQIGNRETLRKAAQFSYGRVFIGWTPLPVIQGIACLLKA